MECNAFAELWPPKRMDKRNSNKKIVTFSFNGIAESFVAENHAASFLPFFLSFVLFLSFFLFVLSHKRKEEIGTMLTFFPIILGEREREKELTYAKVAL